jgi:hypothetical protein
MTNELSSEARSALINAGVSRRGATLPTMTPDSVYMELFTADLIGAAGGLTDRGVIARVRAVAQAMDF